MILSVKKIVGLFVLGMIILSGRAQEKPNIIWLMAEDIGPDIECYGMPAVKTPNLNKLAETGMKFTKAFCTNPICSPSRSAMMTGVHQNKINAQHHRSNRDVTLTPEVQPFTYHLRKAGYTCILGNHGVMGKGRKTDVNFKHKAIGEWDGKENFGLFDKFDTFTAEDQPFFAQIQLVVTHRGDWWDDVRAQSKHRVNPDEVVMPPYMADHPTVRLDWAKYLDQIEYMDNEVGMIVQELKDKGMYENTIIIFIGDNGRCNIRGKGYLFDPGLHVPLVVNWPEGIKENQVRDDVLSTTDITATILDFAGIEIPKYMTGKSFMENNFEREYAYSSRDLWDEVMEKSRSLSSDKYKYIRNDMPEVSWDAHQAYLEFYRPAVHAMRKLKFEGKLNEIEAYFFSNTKPTEELYDLENDPDETKNLADNPEFKSIMEKMRADCKKIEFENTSADNTFHPVFPQSVNILDWVKYKHTLDYLEMLNGKEIGFQKYAKLYKQYQSK
ncbi:sulfatase-like hydrolase/transferase [Draconibacterium sp.]|nr:sulfatase-like hydrolase/transferase [Draconibacterium sp.]